MKARTLFLALLLALTPSHGVGAGAPEPPRHKLHLSSGTAAVEGNLLVLRIRFFKDDLEQALARHGRRAAYTLAAGPESEADFLAYFRTRFALRVGGVALAPTIVASGEDTQDREPVWWYAIQFEAPGEISVFTVRNTLLTEIFDDQRTIVKFVRFPEQVQKTYSFAVGEEEFEVRFR